jgi:hypothetical protein
VAVLLALALAAATAASAASPDAAAPGPGVATGAATARAEIIRLEQVASPPPGEPELLRQIEPKSRQIAFF